MLTGLKISDYAVLSDLEPKCVVEVLPLFGAEVVREKSDGYHVCAKHKSDEVLTISRQKTQGYERNISRLLTLLETSEYNSLCILSCIHQEEKKFNFDYGPLAVTFSDPKACEDYGKETFYEYVKRCGYIDMGKRYKRGPISVELAPNVYLSTLVKRLAKAEKRPLVSLLCEWLSHDEIIGSTDLAILKDKRATASIF